MAGGYVELHAKSFYSFGTGASHAHELLARAGEYGYGSLALTDTNLCGALEFARLANSLGIRPVTGAELTLMDGSRLTLAGPDAAGVRPRLAPPHPGQRRRPQGAPAGPRAPARARRRRAPAHRRPRRAAVAAGAGRPPGGGRGAPQALRGVVRAGLGVRGAAAEPSFGATPPATGSWRGSPVTPACR